MFEQPRGRLPFPEGTGPRLITQREGARGLRRLPLCQYLRRRRPKVAGGVASQLPLGHMANSRCLRVGSPAVDQRISDVEGCLRGLGQDSRLSDPAHSRPLQHPRSYPVLHPQLDRLAQSNQERPGGSRLGCHGDGVRARSKGADSIQFEFKEMGDRILLVFLGSLKGRTLQATLRHGGRTFYLSGVITAYPQSLLELARKWKAARGTHARPCFDAE